MKTCSYHAQIHCQLGSPRWPLKIAARRDAKVAPPQVVCRLAHCYERGQAHMCASCRTCPSCWWAWRKPSGQRTEVDRRAIPVLMAPTPGRAWRPRLGFWYWLCRCPLSSPAYAWNQRRRKIDPPCARCPVNALVIGLQIGILEASSMTRVG
jgi:hypothetical protein